MHLKLLFLSLSLNYCITVCMAQETSTDQLKPARNTVFLELGGNGMLYSPNYDHLLIYSKWFRTSARAGVFFNWWESKPFGFPLEINGLVGKNKHFLEIGAGVMYSYGIEYIHWNAPNVLGKEGYDPYSAIHISGRIGYRFQQSKGGFFLRVAYTPIARLITDNPYYPKGERGFDNFFNWFGISISRSF